MQKLYLINKAVLFLILWLSVVSGVVDIKGEEETKLLDQNSSSDAKWKRNIELEEGETATKPQRRKFGLAWLFSYEDEENDKDKSQQELQAAMDERIRGTRITLEVTKKEQRIEVEGNGQFQPWKSIDWNYTNCSQIPIMPSTVVKSEFVTTAKSNMESRFEALTEDTIHLKCSFYNVHHEVDMDRFSVQWISSKYHPKRQQEQPTENTMLASLDEESCAEKMEYAPQLIKTDVPKCRMSTDFPFEDLKSSLMNISCHSTLTLRNVSANNSAFYTCRAKIGFKAMEMERKRRKIRDPQEEKSFMSNYEMSVELLVRVSRKNDYYVHKIVALVVGGVVVITLFLLVGKKALGHKLGWESKETCNYAPEWPNAVPARTIASAGSLHHSRSTLRRPSEPCIAEEVEDDNDAEDYLYLKPDEHHDHSRFSMDDQDDQNEMNEFLRRVKSHGSFKFTIGDESPRSLPRNPNIARVQNTT